MRELIYGTYVASSDWWGHLNYYAWAFLGKDVAACSWEIIRLDNEMLVILCQFWKHFWCTTISSKILFLKVLEPNM